MRAGRRTAGASRRRRLIFAAVATLLGLALLEGGLRLAGLPPAGTIPLSETPLVIRDQVDGDDWRGWHLFGSEDFVADPSTSDDPASSCLWVPRAGRAPFNADGAVGPTREQPRVAGVLRLLAVGDSNTLSDGEHGWVQQVPGALPLGGLAGCGSVEVLNAGVHGYTAWQGDRRLRRFLGWAPDVVVIAFGWNDPLPVRGPDDPSYGVALAEALRLRRSPPLLDRSALFGSLRALVLGVRHSRAGERPRLALPTFVAQHRAMVAAARAAGAIPVLATRPFVLDPSHEHLAMDVGHEDEVAAYAEAVRELALQEGVLLLDLLAASRGFDRRGDWLDTNHFSPQGHRRAAGLLVELLGGAGLEVCNPQRER
jgi:lysophospholipase L1-like esterase